VEGEERRHKARVLEHECTNIAFEYPSESYSSGLNDVLGESEEEHDRANEGSDDEFVYTGQDAGMGLTDTNPPVVLTRL